MRTQMSPFGHQFMKTPNFERLASQSLVFEQTHVQSQMCVPTRNSFLTGRRPMTTKVFNDGIGNPDFRTAGPAWTTLPGYFKQHGYFTTGVGGSVIWV
jgi:iduronate 2-sulfatase